MIGIYVPTLGRPHKLQALVDNIHQATRTPHGIVFVTERDDPESLRAALATGANAIVNRYEPSYSNALQTAYETFNHPYFVGANDDFDFQPGWDVEALSVMRAPGVMVVGIDDGGPSCDYSTISLIDRRYIDEQSGVADMPRRVNYPYKHNYADTEFFHTAVSRGVFKAATRSVIKHRHPDFGGVDLDDTYRKSQASLSEDGATFNSRAHLWAT